MEQVNGDDKETPVDAGHEDAFLNIIDFFNSIALGTDLLKELPVEFTGKRGLCHGEVDERKAGKIRDRKGLALSQRMIGMKDGAEPEGADQFTFKSGPVVLINIGNDADICLFIIKLADQCIQDAAVHGKADIRVTGREAADKIRQEVLGSSSKKAKLQFTGGIVCSLFDKEQGVFITLHDRFSFVEEDLADGCEMDAVGVPDEKRCAEGILQIMDMTGERRLGQIQLVGCLTVIEQGGQGDKFIESVDVHNNLPLLSNTMPIIV